LLRYRARRIATNRVPAQKAASVITLATQPFQFCAETAPDASEVFVCCRSVSTRIVPQHFNTSVSADFREAGRKNARTAKSTVAPIRRKTYPIEHFWLCEDCAKTMTVALSDGGEIRLIALEASAPGPATVPVPQPCGSYEATAS